MPRLGCRRPGAQLEVTRPKVTSDREEGEEVISRRTDRELLSVSLSLSLCGPLVVLASGGDGGGEGGQTRFPH